MKKAGILIWILVLLGTIALGVILYLVFGGTTSQLSNSPPALPD